MIIDQLPSVGTPALTDETVTEQGQNLFKVTWQRLLALFKANTATSELTNDAGFVNATQAASAAPVQSVNGQTGNVTTTVTPLSDATPSPLGTASSGTSTNASRADHVHAMPTADDVGAMSTWELLWTNASPTSSFAAQTVALDLSGYDFVFVEFLSYDSGLFYVTHICRKSVQTICVGSMSNRINFRHATPSDTGVAFTAGTYVYSGYGSGQSNDSVMIPQKIWGIKGVQTS